RSQHGGGECGKGRSQSDEAAIAAEGEHASILGKIGTRAITWPPIFPLCGKRILCDLHRNEGARGRAAIQIPSLFAAAAMLVAPCPPRRTGTASAAPTTRPGISIWPA